MASKEEIGPGWRTPDGNWQLKNPVELGYERVQKLGHNVVELNFRGAEIIQFPIKTDNEECWHDGC